MEKITSRQIDLWTAICEEVKERQEVGQPYDWQSVMRSVFHIDRFAEIPDLRGVNVSDVIEDWLAYQMQTQAERRVLDTKIESLANMRRQTMPDEEWRETKYDGYYVSSIGRVWSTKRKQGLMTPVLQGEARRQKSKWRMYVQIEGRARFIHRLVATAFVPNPEGHPQVDHIDEDVHNNRADNLRWVTGKDNIETYMANHGYWYKGHRGTPKSLETTR